MQLTGATAAAALLAGCNDNSNGNGTDEEPANDEEEPDDGNGEAIEPGTAIMFDAQTAGWEGIEPGEIEGEQNPTLVLQDGEDYEIGWEESDGAVHNIEIRDDNDDVVDDYETEETDDPDDDQILEITASDEMAAYVCNPHEGTMNGEIQIE